jgi:hypothetical protein
MQAMSRKPEIPASILDAQQEYRGKSKGTGAYNVVYSGPWYCVYMPRITRVAATPLYAPVPFDLVFDLDLAFDLALALIWFPFDLVYAKS